MKPGKYQRSKQRCQGLCCKVQDHAQSFVLRSYTMHELPYLLVYKSTFYDQKINPKNRPRLIHESYAKT